MYAIYSATTHDTASPAEGTRFAAKRSGALYIGRYWQDKNFEAVARLKEVAGAKGQSLAQFSLAWALHNDIVTSVIFGVTSLKQLKENLGATELELTAEQLSACDEIWHQLAPQRFPYGR